MRVAIAGKGGAGKTTLSATLARVAAAAGSAVVAIDADANPNLHAALGMDLSAALVPSPALPTTLVSRRSGGPGLTESIEQVLARYARRGPDGIELIGMGAPAHADEGCLCSAHAVVSALLEDLGDPARLVVIDMEASPEHLSRGTVRHVDAALLVAEPYYRSLETIRRMALLVDELAIPRVGVIANKVRTDEDRQAIAEFCARHGFDLVSTVPWSDRVGEADRARRALVDFAPTDPVVGAVRQLAADLALIADRPEPRVRAARI